VAIARGSEVLSTTRGPCQVEAIRVSAADRADRDLQCRSSGPSLLLVDEDVFLAQLSLRARLLDRAFQQAVLGVLASHAVSDNAAAARTIAHPAHSWRARWSAGGGSTSPLALLRGRSGLLDLKSAPASASQELAGGDSEVLENAVQLECRFGEKPSPVIVDPAPPKLVDRMRQKAAKYLPPHPAATWPLSANILDPVRASVICCGANQMVQIVQWFVLGGPAVGLRVFRVKNKFASASGVVDGYRDVKLCAVFRAACGLGIVGEIQVHDAVLYGLKLKVVPRQVYLPNFLG
jgi:hypothetical protein